VAVATWIALGLLNQARDLWKTFAGRGDLPDGIAWGWRLAAAGRLAIVGLLAASFAVEVLLDRGILSLPERPDDFWNPGAHLRLAVFRLAVLLAVWIVPGPIRIRRRSLWSLVLGLCGGAAAIVGCLLVWSNRTYIHCLVHLALQGIDYAAPPRVADLPAHAYSPEICRLFLCLSFAGGGLAVVGLGLAGQWAWHSTPVTEGRAFVA
jgi:hypothetical protein